MNIDLLAAASFMATHGRLHDRRRFQLLLGAGDAASVLNAVDAYRNLDGGYGWGLEPDLRSGESQPAAAMHALEVFAEAAPATTPHAAALCDWLGGHSLTDGGLPLALPIGDEAGCAPFWAAADPTTSSLQMTTQVAANAHRVARYDPAVAGHPWLAKATEYCIDAIRALEGAPSAHEVLFALRFIDAVAEVVPRAADLIERIRPYVPDGPMPVAGGVEDEALYPLDLAPEPDLPARSLFTKAVIDSDLDRLARLQQPDGGWIVDFASSSPLGALEWRGYATVGAVAVLRHNSR